MTIFADRAAAGRELALHLEHLRGADAVVFGIPRGGVVVAAEVARALGLPLAAIEDREGGERRRRARVFSASSPSIDGMTAIVVDDGVATGATAIAACRALREQGADRIVLAVPVAPEQWRPDPDAVEEFVCPHRIRDFWAVGRFYVDFTQVSDEEVARLLSRDLPVEK